MLLIDVIIDGRFLGLRLVFNGRRRDFRELSPDLCPKIWANSLNLLLRLAILAATRFFIFAGCLGKGICGFCAS